MLKKITLENFFSFGKRTEIELHPDINVLVGINGSGKSNFLKAIRLLHEGIVGEGFEKLFLQEWGGFDSVANFNANQTDEIILSYEFDENAIDKVVDIRGHSGYSFPSSPTYQIRIKKTGHTSYYLSERIFRGRPNAFEYLEMTNARGFISARVSSNTSEKRFYPNETEEFNYKTSELVLRQISDPITFYPLYTLKRAIEESIVYNYFDTTFKSQIRLPQTSGTEKKLFPDAGNINSILMELQNNHTLEYDKLIEFVRKINPDFKGLTFKFLGAKSILHLLENHFSKTVSVEHISDGSLRYLILLSIVFNPNRGNLLCIDEPEIGLHPDMINTLSKAIKDYASKTSQFIFATHSPLLLNCFDLEEILIFEKSQDNQTRVLTKSEEDFEDWNEDYLAGQLWLRGALGGKRW